ncbi:ATP-binding protein [Allosalinactinospora lopnorensis]|uniref:ATP-binding protein n=1 Tax=Allosalinactinospora lopnorensis TaxID=1352348 RepID=UPI000623DD02|nr:ATP-binding protein [Allosalinactinospora lopnorensis]
MAIVPHTAIISSILGVAAGPRWTPRIYPGQLAQTSRLRADLRADLAGFGADLVEAAVLCASEAFANAVEHTRSGGPGGRVVRALHVPAPGRVRLVIVDDGATATAPRVPRQRTAREWETAEHGRGLLLIDNLASAWGGYPVVPFPFCADLGTAVWAEFATGEVLR